MVQLLIEVTGVKKWVRVEDLSGPTLAFEDWISEGNPVAVPLHSAEDMPGSAVVYAGRTEGARTARFVLDSIGVDCKLELSDRIVKGMDTHAGHLPACSWRSGTLRTGEHFDDSEPADGTRLEPEQTVAGHARTDPPGDRPPA